MDPIPFYKMSGSGNDFIIIDNRASVIADEKPTDFIQKVCCRRMSVGADGMILIENDDIVDFKWRFYNSDGSTAEMCGNGARCAARFAYLNKIANASLSFRTEVGIVSAGITDDRVKIKMTDPTDLKSEYTINVEDGPLVISSVNTGVPHVIIHLDHPDHLGDVDVFAKGKEIRFHKDFQPAGTNVNFVAVTGENEIAIRTYERGVENETLACGTGAIASVVLTAFHLGYTSPIRVKTRSGGYLQIYFSRVKDRFSDIFLEGDARVIYMGELCPEAWSY